MGDYGAGQVLCKQSCPFFGFQQQVFVEMTATGVLSHLEESSTLGSSYTGLDSSAFSHYEKQQLSVSQLLPQRSL